MSKKKQLGQVKYYSASLRKEVVGLIEEGQLTVLQACRAYGVKSPQTVYSWIYKYSTTLSKGTRLVVEKESMDHQYEDLKKRNKELEAALGRKQMQLDLYEAILKVASHELDIDLKKSFGSKASEQK